jgi:hypothetical protein
MAIIIRGNHTVGRRQPLRQGAAVEISLGSLFIQQRPSRCLRRQHAVVPVPIGFGLDRGFFTDFCSA